jgi:Gpi18-like mannosyltransferase
MPGHWMSAVRAWLSANGATTAAVVGTCLLLPVLFLQQDSETYRSILLAYALFALGVSGTIVWNRIARSSSPTIAMQARLLPILFLALTVRLIAAHSPGFGFDLSVNKGWAQSATQLGLARSYNEQLGGNILPNYPPLMIVLYWVTGTLYKFAISSHFDALHPDYSIVIRFPAMVADLAACVVVAMVARKAGAQQRWALAALVYALHPVVIYDTGIWGQSDGIYALLMLLSLNALACKRWFWVGVWTACALLTKPQAAAMLPVLLVVLVRYLPGTLSFFGGAFLAGLVTLLPFMVGGSFDAVFAVYQRTIGGYFKRVSIGAYNFWGIFGEVADQSDLDFALNLITLRSAGLLLFAAATLLVLWRLRSSLVSPRNERQHLLGVMLAGALATSAMFIFATEMHERYQFAYVLLALPVAVVSGTGAILYAATSGLILLNLLGEFAFGAIDVALFRMVPALPKIIGVLQIVVFFLTARMAPKLVDAVARPE